MYYTTTDTNGYQKCQMLSLNTDTMLGLLRTMKDKLNSQMLHKPANTKTYTSTLDQYSTQRFGASQLVKKHYKLLKTKVVGQISYHYKSTNTTFQSGMY